MVSIGPKKPSYGNATTSSVNQPRECLVDELVPRLDPVELPATDEESAVDPHVRVVQRDHRRDDSLLVRDHPVLIDLGPHGQELDQPAGRSERIDHLVERCVSEAVAVGREELVVIVQIPLDRLQALTDRRLHSCVDEGDPPAADVTLEQLHTSVCTVTLGRSR